MKIFEIEGQLTPCMKSSVTEACKSWYPDKWAGMFTGTTNTLIVKSKDGRCIYEEFETEFEKNEAWYEINSITMPEKTGDDDNGDWWKKL